MKYDKKNISKMGMMGQCILRWENLKLYYPYQKNATLYMHPHLPSLTYQKNQNAHFYLLSLIEASHYSTFNSTFNERRCYFVTTSLIGWVQT